MIYTIKEVATQLNIKPSTLRYYDQKEILPNIKHNVAGYRFYDDLDLIYLQMIHYFKQAQIPLNDIKKYLFYSLQGDKNSQEKQNLIQTFKTQISDKIMILQSQKDHIDCLIKCN